MSATSEAKPMNGLRVVSFESRRVKEMAQLIAAQGGTPVSAPSLREVPREENPAALAFAEELLAGRYHMVIFLTGVGTRYLFEALEKRYPREELLAALRRVAVLARGPKPIAVLREMAVPIAVAVPEPNTWREIVAELDARRAELPLAGRRVAVQEYGAPNPDLVRELEARGAAVTRVPVYRWALPEDLGPLRAAIRAIVAGEVDVALFTNMMQVIHLFQVAHREGLADKLREAFRRVVVASIGPTASAALREHGLDVDLEPQHPRMGFLVKETAEAAAALLARKRAAAV